MAESFEAVFGITSEEADELPFCKTHDLKKCLYVCFRKECEE